MPKTLGMRGKSIATYIACKTDEALVGLPDGSTVGIVTLSPATSTRTTPGSG
jgi:hypothetical protein